MAQRTIRELEVVSNALLTPHMRRVTLGGEALADFPAGHEGCYVKLLLPKPGAATPAGPALDPSAFIKRSYTVRAFDAERRLLLLDFVCYGEKGPATAWATRAKAGEQVLVAGPGPVKMLDPEADWFALAGDMTALPAIAANLERLPAGARGWAAIEVFSDEDRQTIEAPAGVEIHWVVNPEPTCSNTVLSDHVAGLPWSSGRVGVWVASEFAAMKALRSYLRDTRGVAREDMYISSYWKMGDTDEQHKAAKKAEAAAG